MFNRSRKKIILSIMVPVILLFVITLAVIMIASYQQMRTRNAEILGHYVEMYSPEQQQNGMYGGENSPRRDKRPFDDRHDFELSTFYSVAMSEDGTVLAVDSSDRAVYEEEELIEIAKELLAGNGQSGMRGNLSFIISERDGYTLVAFMDNSVTEGSMDMLLKNVLIIGGIAVVVLFFLSILLSKWIIRPLEENDTRQKQFISDAGHELKTPVAVISANAELLSREIGENEWLANICYENERMGDLVKQLLDLSRAENAEFKMEQVDLSRTVTGEVLAFESLAFDRGKTILSDIGENICISGSSSQITQLVSVLLDNAVRYSTGNEIEVSLKHQGHMAVLSVVNEGEAIPPEKQEHIFDRFYRLDESRSGDEPHYGLGLSIAKAVAEKHGGNITVSCPDGKVCFTVSLPAKK